MDECIHLQSRQSHGIEGIVFERLTSDRDDRLDEGVHSLSVFPDLLLGVRVHAETEEVEEIVQINLPIPFRIDILWKKHPCLLSRDSVPKIIHIPSVAFYYEVLKIV